MWETRNNQYTVNNLLYNREVRESTILPEYVELILDELNLEFIKGGEVPGTHSIDVQNPEYLLNGSQNHN